MGNLLCKLGVHGPAWFSLGDNRRNHAISTNRRRCMICHAEWLVHYTGQPGQGRLYSWRRVA